LKVASMVVMMVDYSAGRWVDEMVALMVEMLADLTVDSMADE